MAELRRADKERILELLAERERRQRQNQFSLWFPDEDIVEPDGSVFYHARRGYTKHLEHFAAGKDFRTRLFMAANRVGKTIAGAYETTCHLTGLYPDWWDGRRFSKPVNWWAAGKNFETTRDIVQAALCGPVVGKGSGKGLEGSGMIPARLMGEPVWKQGSPNLVDTILVKHVTGGWSRLGFKAFEQGRGSFEGTAQHGVWGDEEMPIDVFGECLIRTTTTAGLMILTFTPLEGETQLVKSFLKPDAHTLPED